MFWRRSAEAKHLMENHFPTVTEFDLNLAEKDWKGIVVWKMTCSNLKVSKSGQNNSENQIVT